MAGGRPTLYKPEYCEKVIEMMRDGMSITEIAYHLNVAKSTVYEWIDNQAEFSSAIKAGKDFSEGWWMTKGRENISTKEFNSTLWYMNMKNRFGWKDKQESEVGLSESLMQKVIDKL